MSGMFKHMWKVTRGSTYFAACSAYSMDSPILEDMVLLTDLIKSSSDEDDLGDIVKSQPSRYHRRGFFKCQQQKEVTVSPQR